MHDDSTCVRCSKKFTYAGRGRRSKFCSIPCWGILKQCAHCGTDFWAKANRTIYHNKRCSGLASLLPAEARASWARLSEPSSVEMRFWRNVNKNGGVPVHDTDLGPCWLWTGVIVKDYPKFTVGARLIGAHRYSWELHNGPIPASLWALHKCDNPPCVNPEHLYLGDAIDNARDRSLRRFRCPNCGWRLRLAERSPLHGSKRGSGRSELRQRRPDLRQGVLGI